MDKNYVLDFYKSGWNVKNITDTLAHRLLIA